MGKYEEKPPVVEALQWDGTPKGAADLLELLARREIRMGFKLWTSYDPGEISYSRIEFQRPLGYLRSENEPTIMHERDWLVVHHNGRFEIMTKDEFEHKYKEI